MHVDLDLAAGGRVGDAAVELERHAVLEFRVGVEERGAGRRGSVVREAFRRRRRAPEQRERGRPDGPADVHVRRHVELRAEQRPHLKGRTGGPGLDDERAQRRRAAQPIADDVVFHEVREDEREASTKAQAAGREPNRRGAHVLLVRNRLSRRTARVPFRDR